MSITYEIITDDLPASEAILAKWDDGFRVLIGGYRPGDAQRLVDDRPACDAFFELERREWHKKHAD